MAYTDLFDEINNCLGVSPTGVIRVQAVTGANPNILFAIGTIQVSITIFDVMVQCLFTQGGGTLTVETDIGGLGNLPLTNAMACATDTNVARTTLIDLTAIAPQDVVGPADTIEAAKNAATNVGMVHLVFFLT